jgi:hypothetical protein
MASLKRGEEWGVQRQRQDGHHKERGKRPCGFFLFEVKGGSCGPIPLEIEDPTNRHDALAAGQGAFH